MTEVFQTTQIAAGHDNAAGLTDIEALVDSDGRRFAPVNDFIRWREGADTIRGDGIYVPQGQASFTWESAVLFYGQWYYLYNTILSDNRSGLVTVRTRQFAAGTFANYNATLYIGNPPDLSRGLDRFEPFLWQFTRVTAIT